MDVLKRNPIGLVSLALAFVAFIAVATKGLNAGVSYPNFPAWFSTVIDRSFYGSLLSLGLGFVALKIDHIKKISCWALGISVLTVFLISWLTSIG